MATKIEFYHQLSEHIPEEAARMIAEEVVVEAGLEAKFAALGTKDDLEKLELRMDAKFEALQARMFRWNLTFFVPLWIGTFATLVAVLLRTP